MDAIAVIVAGGSGLRMGSEVPKQFLPLLGVPILARTLMAFGRVPRVSAIILVIPRDHEKLCSETVLKPYDFGQKVHLVQGGKERQDSVHNGLLEAERLSRESDAKPIVLIHDGVRPFVSHRLVNACIDKAQHFGVCIPVLKAVDTLKTTDSSGRILSTIDRSRIVRAQTPQAFDLDLILNAHDKARTEGISGTDDASLMEAAHVPIHTVEGSEINLKITQPSDIILAEALLKGGHPDLQDDLFVIKRQVSPS